MKGVEAGVTNEEGGGGVERGRVGSCRSSMNGPMHLNKALRRIIRKSDRSGKLPGQEEENGVGTRGAGRAAGSGEVAGGQVGGNGVKFHDKTTVPFGDFPRVVSIEKCSDSGQEKGDD
ncbi:hypothetical protein GWI33_018517 [Rhynchophorus ferrugineus]|uniref:Uncharacterized protein n=1 Tax=Rhynchophorus ferrugineus TaxID=354439 RepID=A0A834HVU8_RHYFE|nr:hypothetical protein GWI33_018517 [Rhynchophorus ferrugineus]